MTGRVRHPVVWTYDDLISLPMQDVRAAILCSAGVAANPIRSIDWRGIPLSALLSDVEIDSGALFGRVHSADGYTTLLTRTMLETGLLVLEVEGAPLAAEDGAPARLILPGHLGYKQAKWVERIEWIDQPSGGLWEDRGYDIEGEIGVGIAGIQTVTSHQAGAVEISGVVYGAALTQNVLISIEDGGWMPARIGSSHGDDAGIRIASWSVRWTPPHSGAFIARIRAISESTAEATLTHQIRVS